MKKFTREEIGALFDLPADFVSPRRSWALYRGDWYLVLSYDKQRIEAITGDPAQFEGRNQYGDIAFFSPDEVDAIEEDHIFQPGHLGRIGLCKQCYCVRYMEWHIESISRELDHVHQGAAIQTATNPLGDVDHGPHDEANPETSFYGEDA